MRLYRARMMRVRKKFLRLFWGSFFALIFSNEKYLAFFLLSVHELRFVPTINKQICDLKCTLAASWIFIDTENCLPGDLYCINLFQLFPLSPQCHWQKKCCFVCYGSLAQTWKELSVSSDHFSLFTWLFHIVEESA